MKKRVYFVILVMLLPLFLVFGQEPTIEIVLETDHFLFGQTTWAKYTILNSSEMPIYIGGYQSKNGHFHLLKYEAKAFYQDGKEVQQHRGGEMVVGNSAPPKKILQKGEYVIWSQPIPVTDVTIEELPPGEYKLVFSLKYSLKADEGLFDKEVQTSTKFYIDKPEGEDAAWLQYVSEAKKKLFEENPTKLALKRALGWGDVLECGFCPSGYRDLRAELLQKFPTSTYAAYVIYGRLGNFAYADFTDSKFIRSIETQSILSNSYPTEAGWIWMKGEMNAAWWEKWVNLILKNHPDIWFADELKLKLAVNEIALKKYESGELALEKLAKEGKPNVAERAKELLKVMEEKGWSKKSDATKEIQLPSSKEAKQ